MIFFRLKMSSLYEKNRSRKPENARGFSYDREMTKCDGNRSFKCAELRLTSRLIFPTFFQSASWPYQSSSIDNLRLATFFLVSNHSGGEWNRRVLMISFFLYFLEEFLRRRVCIEKGIWSYCKSLWISLHFLSSNSHDKYCCRKIEKQSLYLLLPGFA